MNGKGSNAEAESENDLRAKIERHVFSLNAEKWSVDSPVERFAVGHLSERAFCASLAMVSGGSNCGKCLWRKSGSRNASCQISHCRENSNMRVIRAARTCSERMQWKL